uniref:RBR-type E3 ubiquitin transferase n=1 Tax=Schistocephalus solidus TaxID=70667 RepID=A0A0X3PF71_SCHSO
MEGINNFAIECELLRSLYPEEIFTYEVDNNIVTKGRFAAHPKVLLKTIVVGPDYNRQLYFTKKITDVSSVMGCQYELDYLPPIYLDFHESMEENCPRKVISPYSMWLSSESTACLKSELESILKNPTYESPLWSCFEYVENNAMHLLFPVSTSGCCLIDLLSVFDNDEFMSKQSLEVLLGTNEAELEARYQSSYHECPVCAFSKKGSKFFRLSQCAHTACLSCMKEAFSMQVNQGFNEGNPQCLFCDSNATQFEIRRILSKKMYERYENFLLARALGSMQDVAVCPRPKCGSSVLLDSPTLGRCPECKFVFCAFCRHAYHGLSACVSFHLSVDEILEIFQGEDCAERRKLIQRFGVEKLKRLADERSTFAFLKSYAQKCPGCSSQVQKRDGCNKMQCTACNAIFCWLCLTRLEKEGYAHFSKGRCAEQLFMPHEIDEVPWDL